jgi:hypothetical protein
MDSAQPEGPTVRALGFEPRAPLAMWQSVSHAWIALPPLAWCEPLPAANGQRMADTASRTGHEKWRDDAPAKGAGMRSFPHVLMAS